MDQERVSFVALHFIPGIGDVLVKQLVSYCGSAEQVFKQSRGRLLKIPGIGEITAEAIHQGRAFDQAEKEFRKAEREETEILLFTDKAYPRRLKSIDDAPSILYVKGNINLNHPKTIAIVGTRQATSYGKAQVERLIEELTPHAPLIISGLAYGIDIHAHKQALKQGLNTVGVLGSGLDVIYPAAHKDTAKRMTNHGGLVTENQFGTQPDDHRHHNRDESVGPHRRNPEPPPRPHQPDGQPVLHDEQIAGPQHKQHNRVPVQPIPHPPPGSGSASGSGVPHHRGGV